MNAKRFANMPAWLSAVAAVIGVVIAGVGLAIANHDGGAKPSLVMTSVSQQLISDQLGFAAEGTVANLDEGWAVYLMASSASNPETLVASSEATVGANGSWSANLTVAPVASGQSFRVRAAAIQVPPPPPCPGGGSCVIVPPPPTLNELLGDSAIQTDIKLFTVGSG